MPDITGLDVAQAIKEIDPDITCVTMTGFGTMDLAIEALKLGIDEFVVKPFSPDELTLTVSKALEKQRLRRENARLRALIPLFELNKTLMTTIDMTRVHPAGCRDRARRNGRRSACLSGAAQETGRNQERSFTGSPPRRSRHRPTSCRRKRTLFDHVISQERPSSCPRRGSTLLCTHARRVPQSPGGQSPSGPGSPDRCSGRDQTRRAPAVQPKRRRVAVGLVRTGGDRH